MLKRLFSSVNFYLIITVNVIYSVDVIKGRIKKLAETDKVNSAAEYVVVRAARGEYFKPDGFETMKFDYTFYEIITNPKNGQPRR